MANQPIKINENVIQTEIQHELIQPFITLCTAILLIWRKSMTDGKIIELMNSLWNDFVDQYQPRSSIGYLIIGKRKTDPTGLVLFCERTFDEDPINRINEWKDRMMHKSFKCADTIFGEKLAHAVLGHIRLYRLSQNEKKTEVEWFDMNGLNLDDISTVINSVCLFVSAIKRIRPVKTIDINVATVVQIKRLPLVGDRLANNIIAARNIRRFANLNDLKRRVNKIGDRIANAFKEFVTFGEDGENSGNQLINVNTDPENLLKELPKVGKIIAKNIVEHRKTTPLTCKTDLLNVPGIGPKTYNAIKDQITI
jgi:competence protein ComEA